MSVVSKKRKRIKGDDERPSCEYCSTTVISDPLVDDGDANWPNESDGGTCAKCHKSYCIACFENIRRKGETPLLYTCQRCGLKTCTSCQEDAGSWARRYYCVRHKKTFVQSEKYQSAHGKCKSKLLETMNRILDCPICPPDVFKPIAVVDDNGEQQEFSSMAKRKALELGNKDSDFD